MFDYDRTATGITQSTKTHTDVTIPYSGQTDPSMTLPAGVDCSPADTADTPSAPCQILPALTLNYQLNGLDAKNTSHSPIQNLVLHAGHLSYGGVGSRARIDSAQVSVSFDNGATWQAVPTHGFDVTDAMARKLVFEGCRCTGVEYDHGGSRHYAAAAREVVLAAGANHGEVVGLLRS